MTQTITTRLELDDDRPEITAGDKLDVTVNTSERKTLTVTAAEDITARDSFQVKKDGQRLGSIRLFRGHNTLDDQDDITDDDIGYVAVHDDLLGSVEAIHTA